MSRNVEANSAKYASVIVAEAAENRGLRKKRTSSIGRGVWASHAAKRPMNTSPITKLATTSGATQPWFGTSMIANNSATSPAIDRTAPIGSSGLSSRRARVGDEPPRQDEGDRAHGHVDEEHRAPSEVLDEQSADHGADGDADAGHPCPHADRAGALGGIAEGVGQDRQGRREDERAADAHEGAGGDEHPRASSPSTPAPRRRRTKPARTTASGAVRSGRPIEPAVRSRHANTIV